MPNAVAIVNDSDVSGIVISVVTVDGQQPLGALHHSRESVGQQRVRSLPLWTRR